MQGMLKTVAVGTILIFGINLDVWSQQPRSFNSAPAITTTLPAHINNPQLLTVECKGISPDNKDAMKTDSGAYVVSEAECNRKGGEIVGTANGQ